MTHFDYLKRIEKLQKAVSNTSAGFAALGGSDKVDSNAYYYTGDTAFPSLLIATSSSTTLYTCQDTSRFNFVQAKPVGEFKKDFKKLVSKKSKSVAVDLRADFAAQMCVRLQKKNKKVVDFSPALLELRAIKEPKEIHLIKKAQKITNACLREARTQWACGKLFGKTENYAAGLCEKKARDLDAALDAFPPMVLSGSRASLFHNSTSNKRISKKEVVLFDVGARDDYYCGDASTTFYEGTDRQVKDALIAVKEAMKAAMKKARPGASAKTLTKTALQVLRQYGFKNNTFSDAHLAIGHFVGLDVHDGGGLRNQVLKKGMCFTIEPGVYVPGKFGVRFEDVVVLE
ncbi:MAG: M24 family metallopeptidase [Candidatus Micrarchaeia archaeon]